MNEGGTSHRSKSGNIAFDQAESEDVKLRVSIHLEEYRSLRSEYSQHLTFQHQILTLTFGLAGALLAATPVLKRAAQDGLYWMYIIAALVFLAISWVQLRYLEANVAIRNYLILDLSKQIKADLGLPSVLSGTPQLDKLHFEVFAWESRGMQSTYRQELWMFPIMGARLFMSILCSIVCFGYGVYKEFNQFSTSIMVWICAGFVACLIAFSILVTLRVLADVRGGPKAEGQPSNNCKISH